jgi:hypothetical protein
MGEVVPAPTQRSCSFCLDTESHGLVCTCVANCGMPDCADPFSAFDYRPPVPTFGGPVTKASKNSRVVPIGVVNIDPEDYGHAINRIVALHKRCPCKGCSTGAQRPACTCCNDYWPCITIRTLRDGTSKFFDSPGDPVPSIA